MVAMVERASQRARPGYLGPAEQRVQPGSYGALSLRAGGVPHLRRAGNFYRPAMAQASAETSGALPGVRLRPARDAGAVPGMWNGDGSEQRSDIRDQRS